MHTRQHMLRQHGGNERAVPLEEEEDRLVCRQQAVQRLTRLRDLYRSPREKLDQVDQHVATAVDAFLVQIPKRALPRRRIQIREEKLGQLGRADERRRRRHAVAGVRRNGRNGRRRRAGGPIERRVVRPQEGRQSQDAVVRAARYGY